MKGLSLAANLNPETLAAKVAVNVAGSAITSALGAGAKAAMGHGAQPDASSGHLSEADMKLVMGTLADAGHVAPRAPDAG